MSYSNSKYKNTSMTVEREPKFQLWLLNGNPNFGLRTHSPETKTHDVSKQASISTKRRIRHRARWCGRNAASTINANKSHEDPPSSSAFWNLNRAKRMFWLMTWNAWGGGSGREGANCEIASTQWQWNSAILTKDDALPVIVTFEMTTSSRDVRSRVYTV